MAAPSITSSFAESFAADSGTTASTISPSGSNTVGYVFLLCSKFAAGSMTATWGSDAMTLIEDIRDAGANTYASVFYKKNPSSGATISWGSGNSALGAVIAVAVQDNDQTTPFGASIDSASADHLDISSNAGELAIAGQWYFSGDPNNNSPSAPAVLIGRTGVSGFDGIAAYSAGANPTVTITFGSTGPMVGVSLKPAAGAAAATVRRRRDNIYYH